MELNQTIELLLNALKEKGIDRADIEKELGYSPNYIDQVLSRGGNQRFLTSLQKYAIGLSIKTKAGGSLSQEEIGAYILRNAAYLSVLMDSICEIHSHLSGRPVASVLREKLEEVRSVEAKFREQHGES
jgi:transcriptional regulator with XRE-family HTH domain